MRRYVVALIVATTTAILASVMWPQIGGEPAPAPSGEAPSDTVEVEDKSTAALSSAIVALDNLTRAIRKGHLRQVASLVRRLAAQRAIAAAADVDASRLNELISARLSPLTHGVGARAEWAPNTTWARSFLVRISRSGRQPEPGHPPLQFSAASESSAGRGGKGHRRAQNGEHHAEDEERDPDPEEDSDVRPDASQVLLDPLEM